jgi:hypothetical protein
MANRRFIDFPIAASVGDNDIVLIWQDGLNKQTTKATLLQGSPQSLAGLTDVDIAGLTNGQILQYNSTLGKWENVDRTDINLSELGDVTIVAPTNGQVLVYNSSTSKWENSSGGYVPYTGAVTTVNLGAQSILAGTFVKAGGTSAQFLKADGSVDSTAYGTGSVTSVGLTMPSAFNVANSPVTTNGTLAVTGAGTVAQYIRGDGSLADFPATTGGGASVSYYLNGSVSQGTIGGVAYREVNRNPVFGAGTDISISSDGYIANFITDAGDPNKLEIPAGNWNLETYFSASSGGGNPSFYVELYKYNGSTFTLIASSATSPELIAFGTNLNPYFSTLAVPQTTLALTDRLALRFYVNTSGRTITLHTENDHLCQVITTFTTGLTALNGLTTQVQFFAVGTSGSDFNIYSATDTHTFNLPTASATNRGALSSADWSTFNGKQNALGYTPVPETRTITINGTTQDLSANRTYNVGDMLLNTYQAVTGTKIFDPNRLLMAGEGTAQPTSLSNTQVSIAALTGHNSFGFNSSNNIYFNKGTTANGGIIAFSNSATRTYTLKDASGTLAFTSDIPANPVGGTGTTNYLPKFTGSTTIGNSLVFDNGTNLGINTASPLSLLHIQSNSSGQTISNVTNLLLENNGSANDFFVFQTATAGGGKSFSITNAGNIGIKTTTPQGVLDVVGVSYFTRGTKWIVVNPNYGGADTHAQLQASTGMALRFATNGDNDRMTLTSGGNLLVGTTTDAGFKLDVNGTGRFSGSGTTTGLTIENSSGSPQNYINFSAGGTIISRLARGNGASGMEVNGLNIDNFSGFKVRLNQLGGSGGTFSVDGGAATFSSSVTANGLHANAGNSARFYRSANDYYWGINNDSNNFLNFGTFAANGTAYGTNPKVILLDNGNVGIGTTTPAHKLSVKGASNYDGVISVDNGTTTGGGAFIIRQNGVNSGFIGVVGSALGNSDRNLAYYGESGIGHRFFVNDGTTSLFLNSSGNVLIGTTTDVGARLHVNGAIRTGAPSGGSAVDWRLGTARGGTITPNAIVRVEIGGVLVDLDARYV